MAAKYAAYKKARWIDVDAPRTAVTVWSNMRVSAEREQRKTAFGVDIDGCAVSMQLGPLGTAYCASVDIQIECEPYDSDVIDYMRYSRYVNIDSKRQHAKAIRVRDYWVCCRTPEIHCAGMSRGVAGAFRRRVWQAETERNAELLEAYFDDRASLIDIALVVFFDDTCVLPVESVGVVLCHHDTLDAEVDAIVLDSYELYRIPDDLERWIEHSVEPLDWMANHT